MPRVNARQKALLVRQLRDDTRAGRRSPVLRRLRMHSALGGRSTLRDKYLEQRGLVRDESYLELLRTQTSHDMPFRFPTPVECERLEQGSFVVGLIGLHGERLCLDPAEWNQGMAIVGGTRMGKTVFLTRLVRHLHSTPGIGLFIADLKLDYLKLMHRGFKAARVKDVPFNLLQHIPGTDIQSHCLQVAVQFGSAGYLQYSQTVLARTLLDMFRRAGQPTLTEFAKEVHQLKSGKTTGLRLDQVNALTGRIDQVCMVLGEKACNIRYGFEPHRHDQQSIVFGLTLGDAPTHAQFTTWLAWWLMTYRKAEGIRPDRLTTAIIADESSYLIFDRPNFPPYIDTLCSQYGEFGVSVIAATQLNFSQAFQANTAIKLLLPEGDFRLFKEQAQAMGLPHNEILWGERKLSRGNAIVSIQEHGEPLLCALSPPEDNIPPATDQDIARSTAELVNEIRQYARPDSRPTIEVAQAPQTTAENDSKPANNDLDMFPDATRLHRFYAEHPEIPVTESYDKAGLNRHRGNNAKNHLEDNDLINLAGCRLRKGSGGTVILAELTKKGSDFIKSRYPEVTPKRLPGRGGLEHRLHASLVARHFARLGCVVQDEPKCDADLAIKHPDRQGWAAIEISNGNSRNLESRVRKNAEAGASQTIIIAHNRAAARRLAKRFPADHEVEVRPVDDFLLEAREVVE